MSAASQRFRDLDVWVESVSLARSVYVLTCNFPPSERFGLTAQLRRAAVSVPSNIAEGSVRRSRREFAHFLEIALGSLAEMETQLEIAGSVIESLVSSLKVQHRIERVRKMLYKLLSAVRPVSAE